MKKYTFRMILVLFAALLLVACGPSEEEQKKAAAAAAAAEAAAKEAAALVLPKDVNDKTAWQNYFKASMTKFLRENPAIKTNHPYIYYVPPGDGDDQKTARDNQLGDVQNSVARGGVAGNLWAFVGPDSKITADQITEAFKDAQDGAFKGVFIVFEGAPADSDRVKEALAKSGADYKFIEVK